MNRRFIHGITALFRGLLFATVMTVCSPIISAAEEAYAPPPAGPYKPVVVVSGEAGYTPDSASKVYKFPSEDMIRGEAPKLTDLPESEKKPAFADVIEQPHYPGVTPSSRQPAAAAAANSVLPPPQPGGVEAWRQSNPWSPLSQPARQQRSQALYQSPGYSPSQSWYPQYDYSQQQYPYGYGYPNNTGNSPYNMPTPWSMMPMQPFFPGR